VRCKMKMGLVKAVCVNLSGLAEGLSPAIMVIRAHGSSLQFRP
jgi:hypothetical protein